MVRKQTPNQEVCVSCLPPTSYNVETIMELLLGVAFIVALCAPLLEKKPPPPPKPIRYQAADALDKLIDEKIDRLADKINKK
jgi:hypothetical protein